MHEDVASIQDLLEVVGRKYPKYVHIGRIDYKAEGSSSTLVSNDPGRVRCSDLRWIGDRVDYGNQRPIEGDAIHFWSPRSLPDPEFYIDINHLAGERPHPDFRTDAHSIRSVMSAEQEVEVDFIATLENLLV